LSGEGTWVYQRKQVEPARNTAAEPTVPTIKATQEGDEKRPVKPLRRQVIPSTRAGDGTPASLPVPTAADLANENIRRFHLSRSNSPLPTAGVSKKRSAAVFVERGGAKKHTLDGTPKQARLTERLVENLAATKPSPTEGDLGDATAHQQEPNGTKYKRPVATARNPPSASTPKKPTLPPSLANRNYQTSNMDQLAREMDAYTLETITRNLDRMEEDDAKARVAVLSPERKSRFRPKAPALRYAQRHPESVAPAPLVQAAELHKEEPEAMDIDMGDATDDEDYVMETYERVPASRLRDQAVPAHRVGLLVFDSEPDKIDFFFGEEGDSSDEFPEDEDDENGRSLLSPCCVPIFNSYVPYYIIPSFESSC